MPVDEKMAFWTDCVEMNSRSDHLLDNELPKIRIDEESVFTAGEAISDWNSIANAGAAKESGHQITPRTSYTVRHIRDDSGCDATSYPAFQGKGEPRRLLFRLFSGHVQDHPFAKGVTS